MSMALSGTSLLLAWAAPHARPPVEQLLPKHFQPVLREGMRRQRTELAQIAGQGPTLSFDNTVAAFGSSGALFERVAAVF